MRTPRAGILLLSFMGMLFAAKPREWKIGKVLDSKAAKTYMVGGASTVGAANVSGSINSSGNLSASGTSESDTIIHNIALSTKELMIVGSEYAYVVTDTKQEAAGPNKLEGSLARAIANRKHGCRFIVGDDIKYLQEKAKLYVLDPDGKECDLEINRQERIAAPTKP